MAEAEGQGEDVGHTGVYIGTVPLVGPQGFPGPGLAQNQGQKVPVGDDLEEKMEEERYLSGHPPHSLAFGQTFCFSKGCSDILILYWQYVKCGDVNFPLSDGDTEAQRGWVT